MTASLQLSGCHVDLPRRRVTRDGETLHLTSTEAALLEALVSTPATPWSRDALMESVWQSPGGDTRVVDAMMRKLRRKIERDPRHPEHLQTVHGVGFRFVAAPAASGPALIGRDGVLASARAALEAGFLVTLVGPGGIGKTAVAKALWRSAEGGVFCDLSSCSRLDDLVAAVGASLGLGSGSSTETIGAAIAARGEAWVVLDNLEQLSPAARAAIGGWRTPRGARLLGTSRSPLGVSGETLIELGPLAADDADRLFRARVQQVAGWTPGTDEDRSVQEVLRSLDGVPLAIELAAARCRSVDLPGLGAQLSSLGRHATMRQAVAWSWGLCSPAEQSAWVQTTVFAGGFTAEAAQQVIRVDGHDPALLLDALRNQSLLRADREAGRVRLHMYEAIRAFGVDEPGAGVQRSQAAERHAQWFAQWAEARSNGVDPVQDPEDLRALQAELDNLRAAHDHSLHAPERAARIALAISGLRHHRALPDGLFEVPGTDLPVGLAARLRFAQARHVRLHDTDAALRHARQALKLATGAFHGRCASLMGLIHYDRGELRDAEDWLDEAIDVAQRHADVLGEMFGVGDIGRVAHLRGDLPRAEACYRRALELGERCGDTSVRGLNTDVLGWVYLHTNRLEDADLAFRRAASDHRDRAEPRHEATTRTGLGTLCTVRGDLEGAVEQLEKASSLAARMGDTTQWTTARIYLSLARHLGSESARALQILDEAAPSAARLAPPVLGGLEHARGLILWANGDPDGAARALEVASDLLHGSGRTEAAGVALDRAWLAGDLQAVPDTAPADADPRWVAQWTVVRAALAGEPAPDVPLVDPYAVVRTTLPRG